MLKVPLFDKQVCFHLGTENGEKQIKKHPYLLLCFISEDIRRTIKRFSFKEVLWLIRLGMVSQLEMQTCQQIHHARWELPPLRWMMSFLPPWPCLPPLLPHDQYSWVANETLWCDRQYSRSCPSFLFLKIWSVSACMWCLYQFPIQGPNTNNFLYFLSQKWPVFHPKLINFWLRN